MKTVTHEFGQNYGSYSFGYTRHAVLELGEDPTSAYQSGFLPYSFTPTPTPVFYMCRSLRVHIPTHTPSSENRRILKKYDGILESREVLLSETAERAAVADMFVAYFARRHGDTVMPHERISRILSLDLPLRVIAYHDESGIVAYVLEVVTNHVSHFWFSCYDAAHDTSSLGMWLILDSVRRGAAEGREYFYIGTGYGAKATYKMNLPRLEFWSGDAWSSDMSELKKLVATDTSREAPSLTSLFYT